MIAFSAMRIGLEHLALGGVLLAAGAPAPAATVTVPGTYPTIQAAIDGSADGSVIQIAPGRYHERLKIQSVGRSLTIRGDVANPAAIVIDGDGASESVIAVLSTGGNVVFEGLTVTGGRGGPGVGGGLFMADSDVAFRSCVFSGNSSEDGGGAFLLRAGGYFQDCVFQDNVAGRYGGGVMINVGVTTVFQDCRFVGNRSGTSDPVYGSGGGVHVNDSSPTFIGCTIDGNRSRGSGGGILVTGHFTESESNVILRDCTIRNNVAGRLAGEPAAEGGGMHVEDNVHARLERCHVHDNSANNGGGLSNYRARYTVTDSLVENNGAVVEDGQGGYGGGLYGQCVQAAPFRQPASITLRRSVVRENAAMVGAGIFMQGDFLSNSTRGQLEVDAALVVQNVAASRGGGLNVDRTDATIRGSRVFANTVTGTLFSYGGGLATVAGSVTTVEDTTFARNAANDVGGAIYVDQGGTLNVTGSRFFQNTAGAVVGNGGGAIGIGQAPGPTPGPVGGTVVGSTFTDDGSNHEIWESNCDQSQWSTVVYRDNTMHNPVGGIYYRNCAGGIATVADFNAVAGKGIGNVDAAPSYATFAATPPAVRASATSVLAWCVPAATTLAVDQGVGTLHGLVGTRDVTPATTTTYGLVADGNAAGSATVSVGCATLGTPVPRRPANGETSMTGTALLAWHPAFGASSYDVYLDTSPEPTTLIASGVTDTTVSVDGLMAATEYHWKVVARSAACDAPTEGPVFGFETCPTSFCEYVDHFGDNDISDWTQVGKAKVLVADGIVQVVAKRAFTLFPPVPALGDASLEVSLLATSRRGVKILFGYQDQRSYRELSIRNSRWKLQGRERGRPIRGGSRKRAVPRDAFIGIRLEVSGPTVTVFVNDTRIHGMTFPRAESGRFGIRTMGGRLGIDSVRIVAAN